MTKLEEAIKTLKENLCGQCAYGSQCMELCDIRSCDNRDAIKYLEMCREDRAERCNTENTLSVEAYDIAIRHIQA